MGDMASQIAVRNALKEGALVGVLLLVAGVSFALWLISRSSTLAWQTLGLLLLSLNQVLSHSILSYFINVAPFGLTYKAAWVVGSLCPLVLMLYLRSITRAHNVRISGVPLFIGLGAVHIALCLAIVATNRYIFIQASQLSVLTILSALMVAGLLQISECRLRYRMTIVLCLALCWAFYCRDIVGSDVSSDARTQSARYASGFSVVVLLLFCCVFWIHRWSVSSQRNEERMADFLSRQDRRLARAVARRTRTLNSMLLAAQNTNREQTRLMAYIGHDLRAPMATIVGYARLLRDNGDATYKKHIAVIEHGAAHQLVLIDELLDHVRGELDLFTLKPVALDLRELLEDIQQHALTMAARHQNTYTFDLPELFPQWVMLDGTRLRQVLLNLISNAAKFTHHGSITLTVAVSSQNAGWTLSFHISDTGTGIDVEHQERIFGSFEQARPLDGGMGLGLFISRSIVEKMGGRLTLSSTPGVGSTFHFEVVVSAVDALVTLTSDSVSDSSAGVKVADPDPDPEPWPWPALAMKRTSPASLTKLSLLASTGQWTEIDQWIAETSRSQPECVDFIATITQLFHDLDFRSICRCALPEVVAVSRHGDVVDASVPRTG